MDAVTSGSARGSPLNTGRELAAAPEGIVEAFGQQSASIGVGGPFQHGPHRVQYESLALHRPGRGGGAAVRGNGASGEEGGEGQAEITVDACGEGNAFRISGRVQKTR